MEEQKRMISLQRRTSEKEGAYRMETNLRASLKQLCESSRVDIRNIILAQAVASELQSPLVSRA